MLWHLLPASGRGCLGAVTPNVLPVSETGWMTTGACREADPELFHPEYTGIMLNAKKVCNRCPVIQECLAYALARMDDEGDDPATRAIGQHGVWGGTTPAERWRLSGRRPSMWGEKAAS